MKGKLLEWCPAAVLALALPLAAAEISAPVETEFGRYEPVKVMVSPAVADQTVAGDFSNVAFFEPQGSRLDHQARELLLANHFVALPGQYKQIHDLYNRVSEHGGPVFVTTDAVLHNFHILYDYSLRILETERFQHDLQALNRALLIAAGNRASIDPGLQEELLALKDYLGLADYLAAPGPDAPQAGSPIAAELALIDAHEGPELSPIFGYREDYSQYLPRGHYTRSAALKHYFRAMMWYGRMSFRLRPGESPAEVELGRRLTRMGLNLAALMQGLEVEGESALTVWERIYRPTVFFVGSADDLTFQEYAALAGEVYGKPAAQLSPEEIADPGRLDEFIRRALALRPPRINSSLLVDGQDAAVHSKGLRFMGQRFIPDSYVMWRLVHPNVGDRYFPRGLDVMAVLGSAEADRLLIDRYGEDAAYPGYRPALDSLKTEFESLPSSTWAENLYWNWLYCLKPFFADKGQGWPQFMRSEAWRRKELGTALGSWAELRHDTILYAKQSYAVETSLPLPPDWAGYVEPEPEVFARLAALARYMRQGLDSRDLLPAAIGGRLQRLESLCLALALIAEKELENRELTAAEEREIKEIGPTLQRLVEFESEEGGQPEWQSDADDQMAVVADVHTDPNSLQVLEVAVGHPLTLLVIVPTASGPALTVGGMFSYYEFRHPLDDRLTDENWQAMLADGRAPQPAEWLEPMLPGAVPAGEPGNSPSRGGAGLGVQLEGPTGVVRAGQPVEVVLRESDPQGRLVRFFVGESLLAEVPLVLDAVKGVLVASAPTAGWPVGMVRAELSEGVGGGIYLQLLAALARSDLDGNSRTDIFDLLELLRSMSRGEGADVNNDGRRDIFDLLKLLEVLVSGDDGTDGEGGEGFAPGEGQFVRLTGLGGCREQQETETIRLAGEQEGGADSLYLEPLENGFRFIHSGAALNCCLDSVSLSMQMGYQRVRIFETGHSAQPCRCICRYEIQGEVYEGLSPGECTVEIANSEAPDEVLIKASVTIR